MVVLKWLNTHIQKKHNTHWHYEIRLKDMEESWESVTSKHDYSDHLYHTPVPSNPAVEVLHCSWLVLLFFQEDPGRCRHHGLVINTGSSLQDLVHLDSALSIVMHTSQIQARYLSFLEWRRPSAGWEWGGDGMEKASEQTETSTIASGPRDVPFTTPSEVVHWQSEVWKSKFLS